MKLKGMTALGALLVAASVLGIVLILLGVIPTWLPRPYLGNFYQYVGLLSFI